MESLLPRSSWAVEKASRLHRMAVISVPFGMVVDQFHPTKAGPGYELTSTLQPLAKLKSDFTVFSNLDHGLRGGKRSGRGDRLDGNPADGAARPQRPSFLPV